MYGQHSPRLRIFGKVHRVLGKSSNDVTTRLDYFVEIVRLGIASGYGMLFVLCKNRDMSTLGLVKDENPVI